MRGTLAAGVVILSACGASLPTGEPPGLQSSPPPAATSAATGASAEALPALDMPGARAGAPGDYGWTGRPGHGASMHWVTGDREAAVIRFLSPNRDACFQSAEVVRVPVTVAGYDGAYLEPFLPPVVFNGTGDEITRAYELNIGPENLLCVFVTWHPTTTADELDAALGILDTIRAESREDGSIRIVFTLADGWDTG